MNLILPGRFQEQIDHAAVAGFFPTAERNQTETKRQTDALYRLGRVWARQGQLERALSALRDQLARA